MQGESVEKTPIGTVLFGKIAVGDGDEHSGWQQSPIENLEQLPLGIAQGQGAGFQAFDVSLEHQTDFSG
jgi:hypothetical protein